MPLNDRARLDPRVTKRISANIRRLRKERGLSQTAIQKKVGLSQGYLSLIERGQMENPSLSLILRVSKILKVTPSELTGLRL
jgi:transcriptional regulator with XRE-family HTH domain